MITLKRILIAEDDPKDIELTIEALSDNRLANKIDVVNDGVEAMDYLRCEGKYKNREKGLPAVLLLDIKMPKMNGIQVLKEIRSDEKLRLLPVVILTSSREGPDLKQCYDLGVNAYVVKPVDFQNFITAVKQTGAFWALLNEQPQLE